MMIILYLMILTPLFLKKYLDYQDSKRSVVPAPYCSKGPEHGSDAYYDQYSQAHYDLLVRCLIFCSFDAEKFKPIEENLSLRDIGSDLDSLFDDNKMESLFRNEFVERSLQPKLLHFKDVTSEISESEWLFESVDVASDERWKIINDTAEELLTEMNIKERGFDFALYVPQ